MSRPSGQQRTHAAGGSNSRVAGGALNDIKLLGQLRSTNALTAAYSAVCCRGTTKEFSTWVLFIAFMIILAAEFTADQECWPLLTCKEGCPKADQLH
jgi:hypothetical protein